MQYGTFYQFVHDHACKVIVDYNDCLHQHDDTLLVRSEAQGRQQAPPLDDPEVLARKAASLDQQRSRFRRALGAQDDVPELEPASAV